LYPLTVEVLAVQVRSTEWALTPLPASVTTLGEFEASLVIERLPLALPVASGLKVALKAELCPPDRVRGRERPLRPKPLPLAVACEMMTLIVPALVSVTLCVLLVPTLTFPKLILVGLAVRRTLAPFPESDTVVGEFAALLTTSTLPVTLPAAWGANLVVNVAFCPAPRVRGRERPLRLKPAPVTTAWESVAEEVPVLVRVTVCVLLVLIATVPKLMLAGLAATRTVAPLPDRDTVAGELEASLTTVMVPVTAPAAWGANLTEKGALCPVVKVKGRESPLMLKPLPATAA
jgi:hypothetical protein